MLSRTLVAVNTIRYIHPSSPQACFNRTLSSLPSLPSKSHKPISIQPDSTSDNQSPETLQKHTSSPSKPGTIKTVAQADEELRQRLEEMSGEGGAAGIEYEDGQPNTMKRSVRNNMFRVI